MFSLLLWLKEYSTTLKMKIITFSAWALLALVGLTMGSPLSQKLMRNSPSSTQGGEDPDPEIQERRNFVKQMMKDAWDDYVRYAWGDNELKPVSQTGETGNIFGDAKVGATIVDSLDTLYIMELMFEFGVARQYVINELNFNQNTTVSVFEVNIRFLGGLLTAYAFTQDQVFLNQAEDIAQRLLPAFDTPTGLPYGHLNVMTGEHDGNTQACIAEFGTLHLEFMYLSEITGNPIYADKVLKVREAMKNIEKPNGLYWAWVDIMTGEFSQNHVTMGAYADSYYEYLLKAAIQFDDAEAREMYDEAVNGFVDNDLVKVSQPSNLLYIAESRNGEVDDVVGHLACFAGGMFALGAHIDPTHPNAARDAEIGQNFTNTCHESYIRTGTGIGPEAFCFKDGLEAQACSERAGAYILRPEVIESYFVLWRVTGDRKYRDWAWDATQAIEIYGKAGPGRGYSGIRNTNSTTNPQQDDNQQSFFLAETLKYLYLIFSSDDLIPLDEWVFNTECHPLPIKATNPRF